MGTDGSIHENSVLNSEMVKNARRSAIATLESLIGRIGIIGVNTLTGVISARLLHPIGRGELAAMILWPVFLANAMTLGVPSATTYRLKCKPTEKAAIVGASLLLSVVTGSAAVLLGWLFMPVWLQQYSPDTVFYARILLLNAVPSAVVLSGRASLESEGEFRTSTALLLWPPLLTLVWLLLLAWTHRFTPAAAAIAYVATGLPPLVYLLRRLYRDFAPVLTRSLPHARLLLSYGIRAYGIDLCGTMALYVDQALVVRLLSPESMGIYVVALSLSRMLNVFHAAVTSVLFPKTVAQDPELVVELTGRAVRITSTLTFACAAGVVCLGPQVLAFLYGRQYSGAASLLSILSLEAVLSGIALVLAQAFMALGRPGLITIFQSAGLLLTIPLVLLLIPKWGLTGAGLALLFSTSVRLCLVIGGYRVFLGRPCPRLFPGFRDLEWIFRESTVGLKAFRRPRVLKAVR